MSDKKLSKTLLVGGLAVAAGVTAACVRALMDANQDPVPSPTPFERLVAGQSVFETLGASEIKRWFQEKSGGSTEGKKTLVSRFSQDLARSFGCDDAENLDPEHYMLQVLLVGPEDKPKAMRLINFSRLEEKFKEWMDQMGGTVLVEG